MPRLASVIATLLLINSSLSEAVWPPAGAQVNNGFGDKWYARNNFYSSEQNSKSHGWAPDGISRPNAPYLAPDGNQNVRPENSNRWNLNVFPNFDGGKVNSNNMYGAGKQTGSQNWNSNEGRQTQHNWQPDFFGQKPARKTEVVHQASNWEDYVDSNAIPDDSDDDSDIFKWNAGKKHKTDQNWGFGGTSQQWSSKEKNSGDGKLDGKWPGNEAKKTNDKKHKFGGKTVAGIDKWMTTTTTTPSYDQFVDEKPSGSRFNPTSSTGQIGNPRDTSILDELDKNDWYFGKDSNFPEIDVNSNLNIDLGELWDFDRRRGLGASSSNGKPWKNNGKSQRRKNRNAEFFGDCQCVDVTFCDEQNIVLSKNNGKVNDWRAVTRCPRLTEVCCTKPKFKYTEASSSDRKNSFRPLNCGQKQFAGNESPDSTDGMPARFGEFPWLLKLETIQEDLGCGASLVHPQLALTAAHCITRINPKDLYVRAGMFSTNDDTFQVRKVAEIIVHPEYNSENPRNDIALIVVAYPFKITENVNTICLPETNDRWDADRCLAAGWQSGSTDGVMGVLNKGLVSFLPQRECQNIMTASDLWRKYVLHESFVCGVEKSRRNSCLGDEGSPVICPSKRSPGIYFQVGLISKSINCDDFGRPGVFTNVLKFIDWINELTFDLNLFDDLEIA